MGFLLQVWPFASMAIRSYSSNWTVLLCTSAPLGLSCDRFDHGSRQVERDPLDLVMEDYNITLHWRIEINIGLCLNEQIVIR